MTNHGIIPGWFTGDQWQELALYVDRLEADLGCVILLAIEQPEVCNFARCTRAGLNREESKTLKIALESARQKRAQSGSRNVSGMIDELTAEKYRRDIAAVRLRFGYHSPEESHGPA